MSPVQKDSDSHLSRTYAHDRQKHRSKSLLSMANIIWAVPILMVHVGGHTHEFYDLVFRLLQPVFVSTHVAGKVILTNFIHVLWEAVVTSISVSSYACRFIFSANLDITANSCHRASSILLCVNNALRTYWREHLLPNLELSVRFSPYATDSHTEHNAQPSIGRLHNNYNNRHEISSESDNSHTYNNCGGDYADDDI